MDSVPVVAAMVEPRRTGAGAGHGVRVHRWRVHGCGCRAWCGRSAWVAGAWVPVLDVVRVEPSRWSGCHGAGAGHGWHGHGCQWVRPNPIESRVHGGA